MCKSKRAINASNPSSFPSNSTPSTRTRIRTRTSYTGSSNSDRPSTSTSDNPTTSTTTTSTSSSLSNLHATLPEQPIIYSLSEIRSATNNFLAKRHNPSSSSTTPSWRCNLRNKDVIIFQRKLKHDNLNHDNLKQYLSLISRTHHVNITKLLGIAVSSEHYIFIVYEFIHGANLAHCLRNPRNPEFTVLSSWVDRMRVAADLASAVDYVHSGTGLKDANFVHDHIRSSSVIVTEPDFSIKLCHFGTALLCGDGGMGSRMREGDTGYLAPELRECGTPTQKSDVYALGVIVLELVSGNEAIKYTFDKETGEFISVSVVGSARRAIDGELRRWVDRRLRDSFPVELVERVVRMALDCVSDDPERRPEMGRVAGKMSRWYMESLKWAEKVKVPSGISVSLAPR